MTKQKPPIACTLLLVLLASCQRDSADGGTQPASQDQPSPQAGPAVRGSESIVREDVLAETETPPRPERKPVSLTISFAEEGDELPAEGSQQLDGLLRQPVMSDPVCVTVRGHTDTGGSDSHNLEISRDRAEAVAAYLSRHGVAEDRIRVIALGERRPIAPNANADGSDNPEGRARNRRVEVEVEPVGNTHPPCGARTAGEEGGEERAAGNGL